MKKRGRPSKKPTISLEKVEKLASYGLIDKQIAAILDIGEVTLNEYKKTWPEFLKSLKRGKEKADAQVVKSLYQRATGYEHEEIQLFQYKGQIIPAKVIKHYAPDPVSMIFWLKNRQPDEWRDKQELEHTLKPYLFDENKERTNEEIGRESLEIARTIMEKRKGISVPSEN